MSLQLLQIANRHGSHRTGDDDNGDLMVQNPDDVSGGSDQDDSDLERDTGGSMIARRDDSDNEGEGEEDPYGGGADYPMAVPDDEDDDEDDELPPTSAPKSRVTSSGGGGGGGGVGGVGTMDKFLMKPSEVAQSKRKSAAQTKEMTKSLKQKAMRTGSASAWAAGAPPKPTNPSEESQPQHFSLHSDESDDGGLGALTIPQNRGVPMPPPDCIQEFENQRTNGLSSAAATNDAALKVHPDALSIAYVMKNEKVNKWWKLDSSLLVYAPDPRKTVPHQFTMEELTISSKPLREAMQKKLCNANPNWVANSAVILKLPTDGKLDLPLADAPGIVMAVPYILKPEGDKSLGDFRGKLASEDGTRPDLIHGLLALGIDTIKAAYAIKQCPLPAQFDPTKPSPSTNAKWKVPSKLEEYLKTDDDHFLLGALEKAKRATSHKRPSEDGARGGGSSSKTDGKRQATDGGSSAQPQPQEEEVAHVIQENGVVPRWSGSMMKQFAHTCEPCAVSYMELSCDENQMFTLVKAGPGKWVLLKCLES